MLSLCAPHVLPSILIYGGSSDMKHNLLATLVVSLAVSCVGNAQAVNSQANDSAHYTHAQLHRLLHDAHTPEQYGALANYYSKQQKDYLQQAADAKAEWDRRSQNIVSVAAKYPRPVDSARNLYEYYMYKASEAGALSTKYSQLSAPAGSAKQQ